MGKHADMTCVIRGIPVYYQEYGAGKPVLNIHGWGTDHRMMQGGLEPIFEQTQGYRRIYLDLPGFGQTPAASWINNSDEMVSFICEFIDAVIGQENFLLTGASQGGYLSLGLIHKMSERIDGVLLIVAAIDSLKTDSPDLLKAETIWQSEEFMAMDKSQTLENYLGMAVIATPQMYDKWLRDVQPGLDAADVNVVSDWSLTEYSPDMEGILRKLTFDKPSCIIAGRQDNLADCSYTLAYELATRFPRATYAALDCAGHILHMDNEPLFQELVKNWIWRLEIASK